MCLNACDYFVKAFNKTIFNLFYLLLLSLNIFEYQLKLKYIGKYRKFSNSVERGKLNWAYFASVGAKSF
jgi:hypothetical protein